MLNIVSQIVSILTAIAGILVIAFPALIPVAIGLTAVGAGINTIQAAINGDWVGGIVSGVVGFVNVVTAGLSNALSAVKNAYASACQTVWGMSQLAAQKLLTTLNTLKELVPGTVDGVRNILSDNEILGVLQIVGSLAGAITSEDVLGGFTQGGLNNIFGNGSVMSKLIFKAIESLKEAPIAIDNGIEHIENGDLFHGITTIAFF